MATIKIYNNCFEDKYIEKQYDFSKPLLEQVEKEINFDEYKEALVECYDSETGQTFYAPIEKDECNSVALFVNGQSVKEISKVEETDVITIIFLPMGKNAGTILAGIVIGVAVGMLTFGLGAIAIGAAGATLGLAVIGGGLLGGVVGWLAADKIASLREGNSSSSSSGKDSESSPDVRGAENQSLLNNPFPVVIGKHAVTPYVIGDPYTEYTGTNGKDAYIRVAYLVGYAPLKLTDFKLGDFYLAYNRAFGVDKNTDDYPLVDQNTLLDGFLRGTSINSNGDETGDILSKWKNNDITLEIIQGVPIRDTKGNEYTNYGTIYPNKVVDQQIGANVLYINDSDLADEALVVYKTASFPNKFRTNGVWFTESCPLEFTINLDIPNGAYGTYTKTTDNNSVVKYESIPLWFAIQWRPYSSQNASSDSEGRDYDDWNNITTWNNKNYAQTYDLPAFKADAAAHRGNTIDTSATVTSASKKGLSNLDLYKTLKPDGTYHTYYNSTGNGFSLKEETAGALWWTTHKVKLNMGAFYTYFDGTAYFGELADENDVFKSTPVPCFFTESKTFGGNGYLPANTLFIDSTFEKSTTLPYIAVSSITSWTVVPVTTFNAKIYSAVKYSKGKLDNKKHRNYDITVKYIAIARTYTLCTPTSVYKGAGNWLDKTLCNFQPLTGENGVNQIRLSSKVTLSKSKCKSMLESTNSIKGIEVRVLRVSPNYLDQKNSVSDSESAHSYSDVVNVTSIVTKVFDESKLRDEDTLTSEKIMSDEDLKKFCWVAIKAKADASKNIDNQLKKFNCIAESFSPVWDEGAVDADSDEIPVCKWLPENVHRVTKYYGYYSDTEYTTPCNRTSSAYEKEVTQSEYENARHNGYSWYKDEVGSNFTNLIRSIVFPVSCRIFNASNLKKGAYYLPLEAKKYNDATVASSFMLALVGQHNGRVAFGYENIDLLSVADCWNEQQMVSDGSTFSDTVGAHSKGDKVECKFEANGYVYQRQSLQDLLKKIAVAGRCIYTYDEKGRIKLIMDKEADYTKGVIGQQNCLDLQSSYDYSELPAGLRISFSDEKDGYETNGIYCWSDGNTISDYKGQIEDYSIPFVTNDIQCWMLGRYLLGCRLLTREVLTAKISMEGFDLAIGDVVNVNSEELLIGSGSARIKEVIKDKNYIYGVVTDGTYEYTGETESIDGATKSTQGISIMQPKGNITKKVVTFRLAENNRTVVFEDTNTIYKLQKGITNISLFDEPIEITDSLNSNFNFTTDDIALFGLYEKISAKYRITKIKPNGKGTFTLTLNQYNEELYHYGSALPVFKNYMTVPNPVADGTSLSNEPVTKEDITSIAENVATKLITTTIDVNKYTLDLSPEAQSIPVNESGTLTSSWFNISAYLYYKDALVTENVTYKAFLSDGVSEVGTWNGNSCTISSYFLKGDILYLIIRASYTIDGSNVVKREVQAQVSRLYGLGTNVYKMLFPDGEKVRIDDTGTVLEPTQIRAEKRVANGTSENSTVFGKITIETVPNGTEEEYSPYVKVEDEENYSSKKKYYIKTEPFLIKVSDDTVLGSESNVGALFFKEIDL